MPSITLGRPSLLTHPPEGKMDAPETAGDPEKTRLIFFQSGADPRMGVCATGLGRHDHLVQQVRRTLWDGLPERRVGNDGRPRRVPHMFRLAVIQRLPVHVPLRKAQTLRMRKNNPRRSSLPSSGKGLKCGHTTTVLGRLGSRVWPCSTDTGHPTAARSPIRG